MRIETLKTIGGLFITLTIGIVIGYFAQLLEFSLIAFGIQLLSAMTYAIPFQSEKYYDFTGCITYISLVFYAWYNKGINAMTGRDLFVGFLVLIWCTRLGSFLFVRILKSGGADSRFDKARANPLLFLLFWFMQGLWTFFTVLPVLLMITRVGSVPEDISALDLTAGFGIWLTGFMCESLADHQKFLFRQNPKNRHHFIRTGLWKYSRHPNYFGEILVWWGMFFFCVRGLPVQDVLVASISPLFIVCLLCFISGIPLLEKSAEDKWGKLRSYQEYKKNTNVLFPYFPRTNV